MKHTRRYAVMLFGFLLVLVGAVALRDLALRGITQSVEVGARTLRSEDSATLTTNGSPLSPLLSTRAATLTTAAGSDKVKDDTKSPKDKGSTDPLPPAESPVDAPVIPADPPATPEEPPVAPEPESPPAPPAAPGAVSEVACVSADMTDIITFAPPAAGEVTTYSLLRSAASDGEYSLVTTAGPDGRTFVVPVSATGSWWYRVSVSGPGGEGPVSAAASNARVLMSAEVTPAGRTLRASNGEIELTLAPGSYATTTTVTVTEVSGSPTGGLISLAGVYEITPSGSLGAPATVRIAYTLPVEHFQVAQALLSAAGLMTYDETSGRWVTGSSSLTADGGYLSGTLSHFSYWVLGTIQPHGTSTTTYCSSGGICHDLSTYPGSATRIAARSSEVCYNCHGNDDPAKTGAGAGEGARNIQAEFFQIPTFPAPAGGSWHPVATGGLYCTACHDPHADPATSPGLLKSWSPVTGTYIAGGGGFAPGSDFCWTCHGAIKNRRVEYLHPDYYTDSGGDKLTGFNGAHTALRTATERYASIEEFERGYMNGTRVTADGTVAIAQTPGELSKTGINPVASPAVTGNWGGSGAKAAYDGDWANTKLYWSATAMGASAANGWIGQASLTVDMGSTTQVDSFDMLFLNNLGCIPDRIEIQTSDSGLDGSWTTLVTRGTLGVRPTVIDASLSGSATCRFVRFVFWRDFTDPYGDPATGIVAVTEVSINGVPSSGTYTIRPDVAQKTTYAGGTVRWQANVLPYHTFLVEARGSIDNGTTWTSWQPVTNGGPLTQIPSGASLERALLQVRVTMGTSVAGDSPLLGMIEVTTVRGAITGTTPTWTGGSRPNECLTCHQSHGADRPGLVTTATTAACKSCHGGAYGSSYVGKAQFETSAHASVPCGDCHTAHGKASGTGVTYRFLLKDSRPAACLSSCHAHDGVAASLDAKEGSGSEWAKHDVFSAEQVKTGSTMSCRSCHSTHFSSTGLVNPDALTSAYTTLIDDPLLIDTAQVVIPASRDTVLDSANPTLNYGASTQVSISSTNRLLLYFDLSTLPAGVTIQNATLVLWPSDSNYTTYYNNYCQIYPVTRNWVEGTGTGTPNSVGVNGATWDSWQFGSAWTTAGGDIGAVIGPVQGGHARDVTSLVRSLYQAPGSNFGMMVEKHPSYPAAIPIYTDEYSTGTKYSPHLRIVYQTGRREGPQILDDSTFCLKCHDGSMPQGLSAQTGVSAISTAWNATTSGNTHGKSRGIGPESDILSFNSADPGGGSLRFPYSYGMDALACTTCHDPHGSRLPYHLKQVVNGRDMTPVFSAGWDAAAAGDEVISAWFCGACHIYPPGHASYEGSQTATCVPCHRGGH